MKAIFPWSLFTALVLALIISIKPLTISILESYTSLVLENNVTVTSLSFVDTNLSLHVEGEANTLNIQIVNFSPFVLDATYYGKIEAFKKYHPLKGDANIKARVVYEDSLIVNAKISLYKLNTDIIVQTNNNDFKISSSLKLPYLDKTDIYATGTYDKNLKAQVSLKFKNDEIKLENILYADEKLSLKTSYLDNPLFLSIQDNRLNYKIKDLSLKKIFKIIKQKELIQGDIDLNGETNLRNLKSKIIIDSKNISIYNTNLKALHVESVADLNRTSFDVNLNLKGHTLELNGALDYSKELAVKLFSKNFDSDTSFYTNGKTFKLLSSHLNLQRAQKAFNLKELAFGDVDLEASGNFKNINFKVNSAEINIPKIDTILKPFSLMLSGNYTKEKITFSPYIKNKNYILSKGRNIYDFKNKILLLNQQLLLRERKLLIPLIIKANLKLTKPYNAKALIHTKLSKGLIRLDLDKNALHVDFNSLKLTTIDNFIDKNNLFENGYIDGKINYNIKTKDAISKIKLYDATLNGIDLDKSLLNLEDALGLNIVSLGRNMINNYESENQTTYIKHLELDTTLKNNKLTLNDVAMSSNDFRIAAFGDLEINGDINKLNIAILDKNGCALITQEVVGNIQNPKPQSTSTAILGVASAIPSSLLNTGSKLINFGASTIDGIASFALEKTHIKEDGISFTSKLVTTSGNILKNTSDIVLPIECKVVYNGVVKHPIQKKKK